MSVSDTIKQILVSHVYVEVPVDQMGEQDSLRDVFGVDSIGFVELRVQLEEAFEVTISDEEFTPENFATVAAATALVEKLLAAPAAA
ncbi:acyl carrier protein [Kitasatospora sp. NPDC051984]|uniref:acyl carrier protein n=1 Tax=Kitasatospora sp. NPDC051984 TaxID=3364059 RepID=UPI0037CAF4BA